MQQVLKITLLQNVAGSIVPLDTPAVAAARADHLRAVGAQIALTGH